MRRATSLFVGSLLLVAGCAGNHGGPNGANYASAQQHVNIPAPPPPAPEPATFSPLVVQVTNGSTAAISVSASTPDLDFPLGTVNPGESISVDLGELPADVVLQATAI